jgi:hypothetical protein
MNTRNEEAGAVQIIVHAQPSRRMGGQAVSPSFLKLEFLFPNTGIIALRAVRRQERHHLRVEGEARHVLAPVVGQRAEVFVGMCPRQFLRRPVHEREDHIRIVGAAAKPGTAGASFDSGISGFGPGSRHLGVCT